MHPETGVIIPLFGSKADSQIFGRTNQSFSLPVSHTILENLPKRFSSLKKQWLYVLTDCDNEVVQLLAPFNTPPAKIQAYQKLSETEEEISLARLATRPHQEFLGIANIKDKHPTVIVLNTGTVGPQKVSHISDTLIEVLQNLHESQHQNLALVAGITIDRQPRLSRILMPVSGVTTLTGFTSDQGTIALQLAHPARQLTSAEMLKPDSLPRASALERAIGSPLQNKHRLDIAISVEGENGETLYHRIGGLPEPTRWTGEDGLIPEQEISHSIRQLLTFATTPQLRHQSLFIIEHDPEKSLADIYPHSHRSINHHLLQVMQNKHQELNRILKNSFDIAANDDFSQNMLAFSLPQLRPPKEVPQIQSEAAHRDTDAPPTEETSISDNAPSDGIPSDNETNVTTPAEIQTPPSQQQPTGAPESPHTEEDESGEESDAVQPAPIPPLTLPASYDDETRKSIGEALTQQAQRHSTQQEETEEEDASDESSADLLTHQVEQWITSNISEYRGLIHARSPSSNHTLALVNLHTDSVIPLLGSETRQTSNRKEPLKSTIPINIKFLTALQEQCLELGQSPWFYGLLDKEGRVTQLLLPATAPMNHCGAFVEADEDGAGAHLDLNRAIPKPGQSLIAFASMTSKNPWLITINTSSQNLSKHPVLRVPTELIETLQDMPGNEQDGLALFTGTGGYPATPHRMLSPVNSLTTEVGFRNDRTKLPTIAISTTFPPRQLTISEQRQTGIWQEESTESQLLPLTTHSGTERKLELAILANSDDNGKHALPVADLPAPTDWQTGRKIIPTGKLEIPLQYLLKLAASPQLLHQPLVIVEYFSATKPPKTHYLSELTLHQLLLSVPGTTEEELEQLLRDSFDIAITPRQGNFIIELPQVDLRTGELKARPSRDSDMPPTDQQEETYSGITFSAAAAENVDRALLHPITKEQREDAISQQLDTTTTGKAFAQTIENWLTHHIEEFPSLILPKTRSRGHQLVLVNPLSKLVIPLLGAGQRSIAGKREKEQYIPIFQEILDELSRDVPDLKQDWLLALSENNKVSHLISPVTTPVKDTDLYSVGGDEEPDFLNLSQLSPLPGQEILGLANISIQDPFIIALGKTSGQATQPSLVSAETISTLHKLPEEQRKNLALVKALSGKNNRLHLTTVLMPLDSLITKDGFITETGKIAVTTHYPARQLNLEEIHNPQTPPQASKLQTFMAQPPASLKRFGLSIGVTGKDGKTIYQPLADLPSPEDWVQGEKMIPSKRLAFSLRDLMTWATSTELRNQQLFVIEYFHFTGGNKIYPLSRQTLLDTLLSYFGEEERLTSYLENPFDITVTPEIQGQHVEWELPAPRTRPQTSTAPTKQNTPPATPIPTPKEPDSSLSSTTTPATPPTSRGHQERSWLNTSHAVKVAQRGQTAGDIHKSMPHEPKARNKRHMTLSDLPQDNQSSSQNKTAEIVKLLKERVASIQPQQSTPKQHQPVRSQKKNMSVSDLSKDPKTPSLDNANALQQLDAEKIQAELDKILLDISKSSQPSPAEQIATAPLAKASKHSPSTPWQSQSTDKNSNEKGKTTPASPSRTPKNLRIAGNTEKKTMDMLAYTHGEREARMRALEEKAREEIKRNMKKKGSGGGAPGGGPSPFAPISEQERADIAPHIDTHPLERPWAWFRNQAFDHPYYAGGLLALGILALDIYKQWSQYPGPREVLIKKTLDIMDPAATPFWHEALEQLVKGTPDNLLSAWRPDALNWWVSQACQQWCSRHRCNARHMPDVFLHYVLSPVSADKEKLQREIQLRVSEEVIQSKDPWLQTVSRRRKGLPAAMDFDPVSRNWWMTSLNDHGLLQKAHNQTGQTHLPVKVMRNSFLETAVTSPQHQRYSEVFHQGSLTDTTNQYRPVIPYPMERQRYGVYTCSTTDGDNWWAIDVTGDEPGLYGLPAIIGYAHQAVDGKCVVNSMDKWLAVLHENGAMSILNPENKPNYPISLSLSDTIKDNSQPLSSENCQLQFWKNRHWRDLQLTDREPDIVDVDLPQNAFYRLRCNGLTSTFTLDKSLNMLDIWSWPPTGVNTTQQEMTVR